MSNKKKSPAKKKNGIMLSRTGPKLILLLAVLILVVSIVTMSYSWFEPGVKKRTGMEYKADVNVRSEKCAIVGNYIGVKDPDDNDKIKYTTAAGASQTVSGNDIKYFRTVIANTDPNPTNVSLYISSLPAPSENNSAYGLGVASPSNSFHKYSAAQQNIYIVRNAYIAGESEGENGELYVDWFIKPNGNSVPITFSNLYLMYN